MTNTRQNLPSPSGPQNRRVFTPFPENLSLEALTDADATTYRVVFFENNTVADPPANPGLLAKTFALRIAQLLSRASLAVNDILVTEDTNKTYTVRLRSTLAAMLPPAFSLDKVNGDTMKASLMSSALNPADCWIVHLQTATVGAEGTGPTTGPVTAAPPSLLKYLEEQGGLLISWHLGSMRYSDQPVEMEYRANTMVAFSALLPTGAHVPTSFSPQENTALQACYFCRHMGHPRSACSSAPMCSCGSRGHHPAKCRHRRPGTSAAVPSLLHGAKKAPVVLGAAKKTHPPPVKHRATASPLKRQRAELTPADIPTTPVWNSVTSPQQNLISRRAENQAGTPTGAPNKLNEPFQETHADTQRKRPAPTPSSSENLMETLTSVSGTETTPRPVPSHVEVDEPEIVIAEGGAPSIQLEGAHSPSNQPSTEEPQTPASQTSPPN